GPRRRGACLPGAGGQAVEQKGLGPGKADREEQRDRAGRWPGDRTGADRAQGDEPFPVRRPGQDVRRVVCVDLGQGVGDQQRSGGRQIQPELRAGPLLATPAGPRGWGPRGATWPPGRTQEAPIPGAGLLVARTPIWAPPPAALASAPAWQAPPASGRTRSANAARRAGSREYTRTSPSSRTTPSAHTWVYAWTPVPMTATVPAPGGARASAATAPIAPTRRGPRSLPMATARPGPEDSSCTTVTWAPGLPGIVSYERYPNHEPRSRPVVNTSRPSPRSV